MKYDTIDPKILAERLIIARKAASITQEAASSHLNISRPTFIAIEKGTRRPRPEELVKLSELYKEPLHNILRSESRPPALKPHLRSMLDECNGGQQELDAGIGMLASFIDDYQYLEGLMNVRAAAHFPPVVNRGPGSIERFAEHCAEVERARLNLGSHQPVYKLRSALEDAGLHVFMGKLDGKLAGLYVFAPEFGYCILVNRQHRRERRRWTIAHEYGHYLFDRDKPGADFLASSGKKSESERFADAFASAFLMPSSGVQQRFYEEYDRTGDFIVSNLLRMAEYFAVSLPAIALRLEALNLIGRGSWDLIRKSGNTLSELKELAGIESEDDGDSSDLYPQRYKLLAVQAFSEEKISEGQLAKLLRCSRIEAREIVDTVLSVSEDDSNSYVPVSLSHSLLKSA
jgi:Zn-dependent peptidase ImmA (M78 family)/transcriptional regulator with XRE-family HTH domain